MERIADTLPEPRHQSVKRKTPSPRPVTGQRIHAVAEASAKPAAAKPKAKAKDNKKPGEAIAAWWPVAAGLLMAGFAADWYHGCAQIGIWNLDLFFPFAQLAQHREFGFSEHMAAELPTLALYLQFPLEGLLTKLTLDRGKGLQTAILQLVLIHGLCFLVLWMLPFLQKH